MVVGNALIVYSDEAFEYEARLESLLRGRATGGIARPLAVEGRIRLEYEATGEEERTWGVLEGSAVPQPLIGVLEWPAVGPSCFLLADY